MLCLRKELRANNETVSSQFFPWEVKISISDIASPTMVYLVLFFFLKKRMNQEFWTQI